MWLENELVRGKCSRMNKNIPKDGTSRLFLIRIRVLDNRFRTWSDLVKLPLHFSMLYFSAQSITQH